MGWFSSQTHNFLEKLIYFLNFDKYICISESTKRRLLKLGKKSSKIELIYPGIDYNHWDPKKYNGEKLKSQLGLENYFVYLFYGRPGVSKGLEYLIKAVPSISKKIKNSKLLAIISRDQAYEKQFIKITDLIRKLKIQDKVLIHKPVSYNELPQFIYSADCVVIPSLAEGFGFTTVESCAMRKPVVVSDTTSLPEVVSGEHILVKPKSSEAIADGVERVYQNKAVVKPLKIFSEKDSVEKYLKAYNSLLN